MTGLADVDGFKICIQVNVWLGFPPLNIKLSNKLSIILYDCGRTSSMKQIDIICGLIMWQAKIKGLKLINTQNI